MASEYFSTLDYEAQKRYLKKLVIDDETVPDSYGIAKDSFLDQVTMWPNLEFGDIYIYLPDWHKAVFYKRQAEGLQVTTSLQVHVHP